jgi:hypothetical protein
VRRPTPYLLLGVLLLATGLGVGLGLSEAPVAHAASGPAPVSAGPSPGICTELSTDTGPAITCETAGTDGISGSIHLTFRPETKIPSGLAHCLANVRLTEAVPRGAAGFRRAIVALRARALSICADRR